MNQNCKKNIIDLLTVFFLGIVIIALIAGGVSTLVWLSECSFKEYIAYFMFSIISGMVILFVGGVALFPLSIMDNRVGEWATRILFKVFIDE